MTANVVLEKSFMPCGMLLTCMSMLLYGELLPYNVLISSNFQLCLTLICTCFLPSDCRQALQDHNLAASQQPHTIKLTMQLHNLSGMITNAKLQWARQLSWVSSSCKICYNAMALVWLKC